MTKLLEKALKKVSSLPKEEQDAIASQILAELEDEEAWAKRFAASGGKLRRLAEGARAEHRQGKTRPLAGVIAEKKSNRLAREANARFLRSGIAIDDVYGKLTEQDPSILPCSSLRNT